MSVSVHVFDRIVKRVDDVVTELDFTVSDDLATACITPNMDREECLKLGVLIGLQHNRRALLMKALKTNTVVD